MEDRADLREGHRLGIISDNLLTDLLERERVSAAEAQAIRGSIARQREQGRAIENLRLCEAIASRELEIALLNRDAVAAQKAELEVAHFKRRIAEAVEQRASATIPNAPEPRKSELPPECVEALSLVRDMRNVAKHLRGTATSSRLVPQTAIGELDAQLCLAWENVAPLPGSDQPAASLRLLAMKHYDAGRLLSARNAEKAALRYYENLGLKVEDVSAMQISCDSENWRDFDIRAGRRCVDVKSARESLHGNGHYVEHSVAKFKQSRESGAEVSIAAVVSPYITDIQRYFTSPQVATLLGEVTAAETGALLRWARERFGDRLEVREPSSNEFLPGWLFEFPPEHYPRRAAAIGAAPEILRRLLEALAYSCEVPGWLWVFSGAPIPEGLPAATVLRDLRSLRETIGITRRSLYVLALGLALEELHDPAAAGAGSRLADLMQVCRLTGGGAPNQVNLSPFGLDDPLAYVHNVIAALSEIVSTLQRRQIDIAGFRLVNPSILQGVRENGERITLLAYCGGWQSRPVRARCGYLPLSIARHATCPSCSHLICAKCGHCSDRCDQCEQRQAAIVDEFDRARMESASSSRKRFEGDPGEVPF